MASPPIAPVCPRCGEPRILAPECPRCGVLYARARARGVPEAPPQTAPMPMASHAESLLAQPEKALAWDGDKEQARWELRMHLFALPCALAGMWLLVSHSPGTLFLLRTVLAMWVHELGHALTAWLCGFPAMPGAWETAVGEARTTPVFVMVAFLLMGLGFRGVLLRSRFLVLTSALGLVLQFVGSVVLTPTTAQMLITFGGDGGALVLGALLMAAVYAPPESAPRQGALHWGLLVIGAVAFVCTVHRWWECRTDLSRIPFGTQNGILSDPSKLVDGYGWDEVTLVQRYLWLGFACLAVLALVHARALWRDRAALRALEHARGG